ncbi:MAG: selenoneine synthase SenA [Acidobacteriota bacterium]
MNKIDCQFSAEEIIQMLKEARARTLELVADLSDEQMMAEKLDIINPPLWEIGHIAWFQENWALRHLRKHQPILVNGDELYDSAKVAHDTRWDLPLPSRQQTLSYMQQVLDLVIEELSSHPNAEEIYFHLLPLFHEDMHAEALTYTRQTMRYPTPLLTPSSSLPKNFLPTIPTNDQVTISNLGGPLPGDVEIPGGSLLLGATTSQPFVFDNEKWGHWVDIAPFCIARAPVTNIEFAAFVDDQGYQYQSWWSEAGWVWRQRVDTQHPRYWHRESNGRWFCWQFDRLIPLPEHQPVIHISWFEAEAYCRWAGRRLPSEAEWEMAASTEPGFNREDKSVMVEYKRNFPWGDTFPNWAMANLDWQAMGCLDVGALPASESAWGCRQMIGNVWEWTASTFLPYPGFIIDPYKEYSAPWFGTQKVLRGGCWTTRARLIRNTWRNFYTPDRRDVFAGFRTCAT